ncbi:PREDICTED: OTU domain-containing protein At3g57810-like [Ipomoea nil]|uniref:OTU domain-containing protein At3g57810-like n=1 Tax=Ipomoea nil TaxID=35883 RepID=UPI000901DA8F|nr:PREDICTED: OTU domain-containing protein At3g57810-like [Ipomoea nil]XP_019187710.1 PREDICTED: OTU domain-containing protein At3g57810-like [Ipomoea nil]XP_019187711.1 PREDICTED: OTU domain-containing protein At3g57810-like [Ipomoea nil]
MSICSSIKSCVKSIVCLRGCLEGQMNSQFCDTARSSCCFRISVWHPKFNYATVSSSKPNCSAPITFQAFRRSFGPTISKSKDGNQSLKFTSTVNSAGSRKTCLDISTGTQNMNMKLLIPSQAKSHGIKFNLGPNSWPQFFTSVGLFSGLLVCCSNSGRVHAKSVDHIENKEDGSDSSFLAYSHGKEVHTDYSVTGIPGDGRCMFRSVVHGACLRSGKAAPDEKLQRQLADELREKVADEFIKRREETEWFIEGDFDKYVAQMRKPHVWGGEPELLMASHVLQMPITVYIYDQKSRGLISIAEYGQEEYGKDDPIKVLYNGSGHYDALQIPGTKGTRSKL